MSNESVEIGRLYEPIKRIADTLQSSQDKIFLELPSLVAWWPGGPSTGINQAIDVPNGRALTAAGNSLFGYDGHPYISLDGTAGDYFAAGSFPSCIGTEAWVDPAVRGLTIGCWLYMESHAAVGSGIISRWGASANRGYVLYHSTATNEISLAISQSGVATIGVGVAAPPVGSWVFVAARFTPGTEIAVFVNGVKGANITSIYTSLFVSTQSFEVGRYSANNTLQLDGRLRDIFVCQSALSDDLIEEIRSTSAP